MCVCLCVCVCVPMIQCHPPSPVSADTKDDEPFWIDTPCPPSEFWAG